jgi:hypothetical protein
VKLLRSRPACVGVATRLGWRLAWETRYIIILLVSFIKNNSISIYYIYTILVYYTIILYRNKLVNSVTFTSFIKKTQLRVLEAKSSSER